MQAWCCTRLLHRHVSSVRDHPPLQIGMLCDSANRLPVPHIVLTACVPSRRPRDVCRSIRQWRRLNRQHQQQLSKEMSKEVESTEVTPTASTTSNLAQNKSNSSCTSDTADGATSVSTENMNILENTECKFNVNSFKLVYVVNSESYLYKRMALKRAKEVGSTLEGCVL